MISSWRDTQFRTVELATLRASQRRPYVVIAMIRIAAMLVTYGDVSEGFAEQLRRTPYQDLDEGILHITDQIMRIVKPDAQMMKNLATVVDSLAGEEPPESEPSASALKLSTTVDIPPNVNPHTGKSIRVDKAPIFARVKVRKLGSLEGDPFGGPGAMRLGVSGSSSSLASIWGQKGGRHRWFGPRHQQLAGVSQPGWPAATTLNRRTLPSGAGRRDR
jgi:hypothetical protein